MKKQLLIVMLLWSILLIGCGKTVGETKNELETNTDLVVDASRLEDTESDLSKVAENWIEPIYEEFYIDEYIKFNAPSNWKLTTVYNDSKYLWKPEGDYNNIVALYALTQEITDTGDEDEDFIKYFEKAYVIEIGEITKLSKTSIDGITAYFADFVGEFEDENIPYEGKAFAFIYSGKLYDFIVLESNGLSSNMENVFEETIDSITIGYPSESTEFESTEEYEIIKGKNYTIYNDEVSFEFAVQQKGEELTTMLESYSDSDCLAVLAYLGLLHTAVTSELESYNITINVQSKNLRLNGTENINSDTNEVISNEELSEIVANAYENGDISEDGLKAFDTEYKEVINDFFEMAVYEIDENIQDIQTNMTLYEDDNIKITYQRIESDGVKFQVENMTDETITLMNKSFAINGNNAESASLYANFAPQSKGTATLKTKEFADIDNIERISGTFYVSRGIGKSYDITFSK